MGLHQGNRFRHRLVAAVALELHAGIRCQGFAGHTHRANGIIITAIIENAVHAGGVGIAKEECFVHIALARIGAFFQNGGAVLVGIDRILVFIIAAVRHKGFLGGGGIRCVIILPCGAAQAAHNKERCPHGDEHRCKAQHQHQIHFFFYIHPGTGRLFCHDISFPFLAGLPGIYQGCNALVFSDLNT